MVTNIQKKKTQLKTICFLRSDDNNIDDSSSNHNDDNHITFSLLYMFILNDYILLDSNLIFP